MKDWLYLCILLTPLFGYAQSGNYDIRQGVKAYEKGDFQAAQSAFATAAAANPTDFAPFFNEGDAWYEMDSVGRASSAFETAIAKAANREQQAQAYHNLGNAFLKAQQYDKSVEAFKQALLKNPYDEDTRYNLAYALSKLQQQEQQEQQDNENKEEQEEQEEQDKDQQENQNKDNEEPSEEQEQKDNEQQQQEQQEQEQQPAKQEISQQQAEQILQALEKEEQKIQQQLNKKVQVKTTKKEKDW